MFVDNVIVNGWFILFLREQGHPPAMDPDDDIESNWDQVVDSFDSMKLREPLLRGIYAYG